MRPLFPTILTALAALTIWACTGGDSNSASPGGDGSNGGHAKVQASCDAIKEIKSYRYTISLKLKSPVLEQTEHGNPGPAWRVHAGAH